VRRAARRVVPASGLRHHDDSRHLIASITCRRTPLPVPQPRCRIAAKHPSRAAHLAKIALSKTAAPSLRPLQSVSHGRLRRPTHRSQRPPGRQIAIDGNPHAAHRGFLPWRLSDAGPQCPLLDCEWAGIRNPSQFQSLLDDSSKGAREGGRSSFPISRGVGSERQKRLFRFAPRKTPPLRTTPPEPDIVGENP